MSTLFAFRSLSMLLCGVLAISLPACTGRQKEDRVISVGESDAEMNAAIAKARSLLPEFWRVFGERAGGEEGFNLKVQIQDSNGAEHFWVNEIERKDGKIFGTINNDPEVVKNVKLGQRIQIPEVDISDWLYRRDDKMVGNYTLRVLFKQMSAEEVENYRKMLAEP